MSERNVIIHEDYQTDTIKIYVRERPSYKEEIYYTHGSDGITGHTYVEGQTGPGKRGPFIEMPMRLGTWFLNLLNDEIANKGINQKKVDMQAGKTELLEKELAFNQVQLVKLIDHITK